ncbi:MAG: transglycosylase family protein [Euzebyaceae bacterium]|nr:transglycosylase family protein [Euzebyaceae bacterium]
MTAVALAATMIVALPATAAFAAPAKPRTYNVVAGDSLSSIAQDFGIKGLSGWRRLFDANRKIDNPDLITVGARLRIPAKGAELKRRSLPAPPAPVVVAPVAPPRVDSSASRSSSSTDTSSSDSSSTDTSSAESAPAPPSSAPSSGVWASLAQCESGGNWSIDTGNGYYGGLQFSLSTWQGYGGSGMPHEASASEQIAVAERVQASQGWGAWPACSAELGLR